MTPAVCLTFSRVAMRSMAKVVRCSTRMDMSRQTMAAGRWSFVSCVQTTQSSYCDKRMMWRTTELSVCLEDTLSTFILLLNICTGNLCPFIKPQACQTEGCLSVFRACPVSEEYSRTSAPCNHSKQTCSLHLKDRKVLFPFQILPLNEPHPIKFL